MSRIEAPALITGVKPVVAIYDIGGTRSRAAIGRERIERIGSFPTQRNLEINAERLALLSRQLNSDRKPDYVSAAIAGEVSENGLTIVRAGALQEYGWTDKPVRANLAEANGLPADRARIVNDAASAGYAQREADRCRRMRYLLNGGQGYVETVSTGNGGAIFDLSGSVNVEPGHIPSGEKAPVQCGCKGEDCVEAWIGGSAVAKVWGDRMEDVDIADERWDAYQEAFSRMQIIKLDALRERGHDPEVWYMYGSVALKGPRNILGDFASDLIHDPEHAMPVTAATYGDDSGLYGAYFFLHEQLASAA